MSITDFPFPKLKSGIITNCIAVYVYQIGIKAQIFMTEGNI